MTHRAGQPAVSFDADWRRVRRASFRRQNLMTGSHTDRFSCLESRQTVASRVIFAHTPEINPSSGRSGEATTSGEPGSAGIPSAGRRSVARRTPRIPSERARSRCGYIRSDLIGPSSDDLQFDPCVGSEGCANAATTTRPSGGKSESAVPRVAMAGEENDYGARASSRTPNRVGALTEANVNEMMAPNSAAKLASFKGRWVIARALRINTPGGFSTAA